MELPFDKLKSLAEKGKLNTFTIDTSAFGKPGEENLEGGLLNHLEQFKDSEITFLISEVVCNELIAHMGSAAKATHTAIRTAIRDGLGPWEINRSKLDQLVEGIVGARSPEKVASDRLTKFLSRTGAVTLPVHGSDISREVFDRYFKGIAPFSSKEDKKSEFPDAYALIRLEQWAIKHNKSIAVITNDKDWIEFIQSSKYLFRIERLRQIFDLFNKDVEVVLSQLAVYCGREIKRSIKTQVEDALDAHLDLSPFNIEATSRFIYVEDIHGYHIGEFDFLCEHGGVPIAHIIDKSPTTITAQLYLTIKFEILCDFDLYYDDKIDNEMIRIATEGRSQEVETVLDILITANFNEAGITSITGIEIPDTRHVIDFGEVEPDFGPPDDEWN